VSVERGLIIRGFWLEMILSGKKSWEMRSTPTKIRGRIGLIEKGTGLIVGEVDLIDSLPALNLHDYFDYTPNHRIIYGDNASQKWRYPWVLRGAERYVAPKKYKHPKGAVVWVDLTKGDIT
jgi:ASCH domain